jgi:hypothetical protein
VDPECLSRILIFITIPNESRIQQQQQKRRGKISAIFFFFFFNRYRKKFEPIHKELPYGIVLFSQKIVTVSSQKYGMGFGIQDPGSGKIPIPDPGVEKGPDPGVKKGPDPGSGSTTLTEAI